MVNSVGVVMRAQIVVNINQLNKKCLIDNGKNLLKRMNFIEVSKLSPSYLIPTITDEYHLMSLSRSLRFI